MELVEERRKGNCTERVLQATAASYVISPSALAGSLPIRTAGPTSGPPAGCSRWRGALCARSAT